MASPTAAPLHMCVCHSNTSISINFTILVPVYCLGMYFYSIIPNLTEPVVDIYKMSIFISCLPLSPSLCITAKCAHTHAHGIPSLYLSQSGRNKVHAPYSDRSLRFNNANKRLNCLVILEWKHRELFVENNDLENRLQVGKLEFQLSTIRRNKFHKNVWRYQCWSHSANIFGNNLNCWQFCWAKALNSVRTRQNFDSIIDVTAQATHSNGVR